MAKNEKQMTNLQVADLLRDVAASYKLKNEASNRFKVVAYERAADAVEHASSELKDLWDDGKLDDVPGIGKSIAGHLGEIFKTGKSKHFEEVMHGLPPAMFELMKISGIGPKTAYRLAHELSIKSYSDLEKAAKKGHIAKLPGFGVESEKDILNSLEEYKNKGEKRNLLPYAEQIAQEIIEWVKKNKDVKRVDPLGSSRRKAATVGDIDLSASTTNQKAVLEHFSKYPKASRVLELGTRTSSIVLPSGIQVDLMVETPDAYGALLQHFTGSKHHNIALREYALKKGLSLSDYGIYILNKKGKSRERRAERSAEMAKRMFKRDPGDYRVLKKIATEEEFYKFLGMDYVPPELREDSGEIEAAQSHTLPKVVELKDVKGDLQIHSNFDIETSHDVGASTMEQVVEKANSLGYEYIAFTEHNPAQRTHNNKQIIDLLTAKKEKIDQLNYSISRKKNFRLKKVFNSLEIDIKPDGSLPVPQEGLSTLDFFLVSVHASFDLARDKMTDRVVKALSHPKAKIFAHPTARKINEREGIELDWEKIFDFALKNNKWIEINADPMRLDLPDVLVREAVKKGVKLTLGTDSHHKDMLDNMKWGVYVARRGWAEEKDIVNTRPLEEFEKMLK